MKRIATLVTVLLLAAPLLAQEAPAASKLKTKMFDIHYQFPRDVFRAIKTMGTVGTGADMSYNDEMHTITVKDYPENIAAIEEAIARLDKPKIAASVELKISMLIGSKTPLPGSPTVPDDLAPVVKQLQSTLRYSHYGLLATNIQLTKVGEGLEGSGVAEPTLIGNTSTNPVFYNYRLINIRVEDGVVNVENVIFGLKVPLQMNKGTQYQDVGFKTPVSIKQNEKLVIGTTTMGDRAVIVVLMAKVE